MDCLEVFDTMTEAILYRKMSSEMEKKVFAQTFAMML